MEKQPRIRSDIETILLEVSNISSFLKSEPTHFLIAQKKKAIVKKMVAVLQSPELQMNTQLKSELTKEFEEFRSTLLANKNIRRVLFDMQKGFTALLFCLGGGGNGGRQFPACTRASGGARPHCDGRLS